jgi:diketogulonate reductase-like aldo/keto reductase
MAKNFDIFDVELSDEDMEAIKSLETHKSSFFILNQVMVKWLGERKLDI